MEFLTKVFGKKKKQIKKQTVDEFVNNHINKSGDLPGVFTKEMLEELIKQYPKSEHPNIVESEGKVRFLDSDGRMVQLDVPLLTIVPIPYIPKDSINLDKYFYDFFGHEENPKNIEHIKGVEVDVPKLNLTQIDILIKKEK